MSGRGQTTGRIVTRWICLLAAGAFTAGAAEFPLQVSADRRHLETAEGRPFLVAGDTAWSLIAQLREPEARRYLDDRARRGFTAIIVNLLEHKFADRAPALRDGTAPFLAPGDFARPNPEYLAAAHRVMELANERGLAVFLCAAYLGWAGGDEGFYREIQAAGPAAVHRYGRIVGESFRDLPNIVWMLGGDDAIAPEDRWMANELAAGLREGGARQLMTAHGGQTAAVETFGDQPWLAIDTAYSYVANLYDPMLACYRREPARPYVLIESTYEGEHGAAPEKVRRQAWWAMLDGAAGQFFGNNPIWHFDGPTLFPFSGTWQEAMDAAGSRDMARLARFWAGLPWWRLVPERDGRWITAGRGDGAGRAEAAATPDGKLLVAYVPAGTDAVRVLTLDLSGLAGPAEAEWFDPAAEAAPVAARGKIPNAPRRVFKTPGANGSGANDWVLVIRVPD
ncbi:MAG TPA: DUF4038 domain-containing protein [Opitutus sp.]|nr:DUF4038 domain-containing protein [Opitutus sp.]